MHMSYLFISKGWGRATYAEVLGDEATKDVLQRFSSISPSLLSSRLSHHNATASSVTSPHNSNPKPALNSRSSPFLLFYL